ncbi:MAG TPA: hypothetical protein ENN30_02155, partial [Candidatus Woesearchaeota archaeon]|nr:hypothetical protein [Candidatus Woesearchaeota archaeon]
MLDKLGSALKNSMRSFISSIFVDETTLNKFVNEIQRALLQGDVAVNLVFKISENIKKRAKEEIGKGHVAKEHIVKIVYEELVAILGEEGSKITLTDKPYKILLIGLFGNGKCVHKDSLISLGDGSIEKIKDIYNRYKHEEKKLKDGSGYIIELKNPIKIKSFDLNSLKTVTSEVNLLWKLKKDKKLIKIYLDKGNDQFIITTPEHPFFCLGENGKISQIRADCVKPKYQIAVPKRVEVAGQKISLIEDIKKIKDLAVFCGDDVNIKIGEKYKNLKNLFKKEKLPYNYYHISHYIKHKSYLPLKFLNLLNIDLKDEKVKLTKYKVNSACKPLTIPACLTPELSEFVGYVFSDGYIDRKGVCISTAEDSVVKRIEELSKKLFELKITVTPDKRSKCKNIRISSSILSEFLNLSFDLPFGKKGNIKVPRHVLMSDKLCLTSFIRSYFDCDSYVNNKERQIELCSESSSLV